MFKIPYIFYKVLFIMKTQFLNQKCAMVKREINLNDKNKNEKKT